jgi:hypothetical protein
MKDDSLDRAAPPPRGEGAPMAGGGAAPAPAAHAHAKAKKGAEPAAAAEPERDTASISPAPAPPAEAQSAAKEAPAPAARADDKPAVDSTVARADRLFREGRWVEAARAYRELLRRDPHNADAARWRQRMIAAERAVAPERPAASAAPSR